MKKQVDLGQLGSDFAAIGDKRRRDELGEKQESVPKRSKSKDLHSVFSPQEISTRDKIQLGGEVSSSVHHDSFCSSKTNSHLKLRRDASECGSSTGPSEKKDSLRVWKEMKENGFLSSSPHGGISIQSSLISSIHGGIPMPKQRGRKSKSDELKKKMDLAKKEQVDRLTKIASPSGLLNGLNPGIINHVRNKKQVHSIIEALVRSEKNDQDVNSKQYKHQITETTQIGAGCHLLNRGSLGSAVDYSSGQNLVSCSTADMDSESLALKSSSTKGNSSTDRNTSSCLSVKAASVASQWLELLHQDIKGRLSALQRSRKRVQAVITTELPFLMSKEFASYQDNMISVMHQTKWSTLFDQMDKALSKEEQQLESWLKNVKEMQSHCDQGLQSMNKIFGFMLPETSVNCTRIGKADSIERHLEVRAAAASIYSTCSFLLSKENVSYF